MGQTKVIAGDIDRMSGDLSFEGSLRVEGSIKRGQRLKISGDLLVEGEIEDAEVETGGMITVQGGITGEGKGVILASGGVRAKYINNQTVISHSLVEVSEEIRQAIIKADQMVLVTQGRGWIVGGTITAGREVRARNIGSRYATPTIIKVGFLPEVWDKLDGLRRKIAMKERIRTQMGKELSYLRKLKKQEGKLPPRKEELLQEIDFLHGIYRDQLKEMKEEWDFLENHLQELTVGQVTVEEMIFPGVVINILNSQRKLEEVKRGVIFKKDKDEVIDLPWEVGNSKGK